MLILIQKHMYQTNTDICLKDIPKWQFKKMPETVWFEYGKSMEYIAGTHTSCTHAGYFFH